MAFFNVLCVFAKSRKDIAMRYRFFVLLVLQLCVFTVSFGQVERSLSENLDCFTLKEKSTQAKTDFVFNKNGACKPFSKSLPITGLAISGTVTKTSPDYVVRVVLTDVKGNEYLVMESYEEINSESSFSFSNYCEETSSLPPFSPDSLKVYLKDATINISAFHISQRREGINEHKERRMKQEKSIVDRINEYNKSHRRLWVADTTALSHLDYATRKRILGFADDQPTFGYEYYVAGVFEVGHQTLLSNRTNSPYVESVDWRNRYGKNWMTPVKHQGTSYFCTAFAALGVAEALANIYYNQDLNIDLSEQEIASCASERPHEYTESINPDTAFHYLEVHGVCDESSYPFDPKNSYETIPCMSDDIIPQYSLSIGGNFKTGSTENDLKQALIQYGPLFTSFLLYPTSAHAMTLVGYKTFHVGDTIYRYIPTGGPYFLSPCVLSSKDSLYIGRSYWIFKNSYIETANGSQNNGYKYILFYDEYLSWMSHHTYAFEPPFQLEPMPTLGRNWEDKDGDGTFFWGIGPKPDTCPAWVPDEMDGDDDDPTRGAMDQYGYATLYDGHNHTWNIDVSETFTNDTIISCNLNVSGCQLTVCQTLNMIGIPQIRLQGPAELIVDGGCIYNAEFELSNTCKIILRNGGRILMRRGKNLDVPVGAELIIENGEIKHL